MKIFDFFLVIISTSLLVLNQVMLKLWIQKYNISFWPLKKSLFLAFITYEIPIIIISLIVSGIIWIILLKKIAFSILYPMISLSYIFGMLAAIIIFKEQVPLIRWLGVILIISGVFLISKS